MWSIMIQVETEKDLIQWNEWFNSNTTKTNNNDFLMTDEATCLGSPSSSNNKHFTDGMFNKCEDQEATLCHDTSFTRKIRLDSGITTENLLTTADMTSGFDSTASSIMSSNASDEERRGSEMTLADSGAFYDPDMARHYGTDEINHAKRVQDERREQNQLENASNQPESSQFIELPAVAQSSRSNGRSSFLDMFSTTSDTHSLPK
ncbi:hypothetical protein G6F56_012928 [Rhizopus delemar]|nr:hypothetical protein G6F56_012928 [Rhizopus delemar]